ncbi:MAG: ABC transporter substrate-binding protein [Actinobacteria bacterium]|nr:ABC transporter substrate-binding protein [Actinomycetota bacterium]
MPSGGEGGSGFPHTHGERVDSVKHWTARLSILIAALAILALGLTACGSSSSSSSSGSTEEETTTSSGSEGSGSEKTLIAAADPSLLPYNFYKEGSESEWEGINIDFAEALGKQLGEKIEFTSVPFDSIIPGLKAGRYDLALTGMFDTKEREEVIDFVDYLKAKNNFLLRKDDPETIESFEDLCGKKVGLPKGALEIQLTEEQSEACKKEGKPEVELSVFPDLNATVLALLSERVDVAPNDSAANAYLLQQNPDKLKVTGEYLAEGYFAIGVPKGSENLKPLQEATEALIQSGELKEIFAKWGIEDRTPPKATINNAAF